MIKAGVNAALIRIAQLDAARKYLEETRPYQECIMPPDYDPSTDSVMTGHEVAMDSLKEEIKELKKLVNKETRPR